MRRFVPVALVAAVAAAGAVLYFFDPATGSAIYGNHQAARVDAAGTVTV